MKWQSACPKVQKKIIVLNLIKVIEKKPRESVLRVEFTKAIEHINKGLPDENHLMFFHLDMKNFSRSFKVLPYLIMVGAAAFAQTDILHCQLNPTSKPSEQSDITSSSDTIGSMDPNFGATEVVPLSLQKGVLRTNCMDCLDRTNGAQFAYGLVAFSHQLHVLGLIQVPEIGLNDPLSHSLMDFYESMGDALAVQYTGSAAQNKVLWNQRGQWNAVSHWHQLIRNVQRFVSNAYMDNEKQNALNVFLGHFHPQEGRPTLWRFGSDNYSRKQGILNTEGHERSFKKSFSSSHICPEKAAKGCAGTSQLLPGMMEHDDSKERSDSDSEISSSQAKPSGSGNSNTMQGRHLFAEPIDYLNGSIHQELCSSNFVDLDKLSSSLNSFEEFTWSSMMNSYSATSCHSVESYRGGQNDKQNEKTPLLHKEHSSKLHGFSDCLVQWVLACFTASKQKKSDP